MEESVISSNAVKSRALLPDINMSKVAKEVTTELIKDYFKDKNIDELYKSFIGKTKVEKLGEENFVLQSLMAGKAFNTVAKELETKYPAACIDGHDIKKFAMKNEVYYDFLQQDKSNVARRYFDSKAQCMESLASLALFLKGVVIELREKEDFANVIGAARVLNTTILNYMELEGYKQPTQPVSNMFVNINNEKYMSLRERAHMANFKKKDDEVIDIKADENKV